MYSRFIIFFLLSGMSQVTTEKVKFYCRGLHHGSIFSYKIPSHEFMNKLIDKIYDEYYSILERFKDATKLASIIETLHNIFAECECENEEECKECLEELGNIQSELAFAISDVFKEFEKKAEEHGFIARWYDACDEYDACSYDFYLIITKDNLIRHFLLADFEISIRDTDVGFVLSLLYRTAIYVPEKSIPISLLDRISLVRLPLPDDPEREYVEEIELEPETN